MDLIKTPPAPDGLCLTNNHILWRSFNPIVTQDVEIPGTYTYSLAPDNIRDQGGTTDVPFSTGDLTDRRQAPTAGNVDLKQSKLQDWIVRYKATEPFHITFDLRQPRDLDRMTLFYSHSGLRPAIRVEGSADGNDWSVMGQAPALAQGAKDVWDLEIPLSGGPAQYVRIHFDKRRDGDILTLAEMEIWEKPSLKD